MGMDCSSDRFSDNSAAAVNDPKLSKPLNEMAKIMPFIRDESLGQLSDSAAAVDVSANIRAHTLAHLDFYLEQFERNVIAGGGVVHWAEDAAGANEIVLQICREKQARLVTKSKSMVTEETELAAALENAGIRAVETDLGEYIVQLRKEKPSHILAPALHVSLDEVTDAFLEHHKIERDGPPETADELLAEARQILRSDFINADVGITGANFLIAESGGMVLVTNEGNADLTACIPDTQIVVTGIEKVVPTFEDAGQLLRLLARSAIGQRLSNYTSLYHGPKQGGEFHVVLVDNGRSSMLGTDYQDMLRCIRCSACLNHCPVYSAVGGHAYGSVYSGPMGAVYTPAFAGLAVAKDLPNASTFCGRCADVCPVKIPIPKLLRYWRRDEFSRHLTAKPYRFGLRCWAWLNRYPVLYRKGLSMLTRWLSRRAVNGWLKRLPGVAGGWSDSKDLFVSEDKTFQQQYRERQSKP